MHVQFQRISIYHHMYKEGYFVVPQIGLEILELWESRVQEIPKGRGHRVKLVSRWSYRTLQLNTLSIAVKSPMYGHLQDQKKCPLMRGQREDFTVMHMHAITAFRINHLDQHFIRG